MPEYLDSAPHEAEQKMREQLFGQVLAWDSWPEKLTVLLRKERSAEHPQSAFFEAIAAAGPELFPGDLEKFTALLEKLQAQQFGSDEEMVHAVNLALREFARTNYEPAQLEDFYREKTDEHRSGTQLNRLLYYSLHDDTVALHISSSYTVPMPEKLRLLREGLFALGQKLESDEALKGVHTIEATSWIVAESPAYLERLGFTVGGPISEEVREAHFQGEQRPISTATMDRAAFIRRYH